MSNTLDRQIRPIYDALDTGSSKSAISTCNKLLKKYPTSTLIKALKTLALVRLSKFEESLVLCDEILATKPTDDATLSAMMHVLRGLGRHTDMITMFDNAFKQQPGNEELGVQTFFANVRTGRWKEAQQLATKFHKQFQEDRYLYWSVMCALLQANDPNTIPEMRTLLYKLAHRLVGQSPTPSYKNADRFYLHLYILRELNLFDEARTLLDSEVGKSICSTSLSCDEIRRDISRLQGLWKEEGERAESRILADKDRDWLEFVSVLDAVFAPIASSAVEAVTQNVEEQKLECSRRINKAQEIFQQVAETDDAKDRSGLLALLELEKRARIHGLSSDPAAMLGLMQNYFHKVGGKACCFEDLQPFLQLDANDLTSWTDFLHSIPTTFVTTTELQRIINVQKLLRYNLSDNDLTVEAETSRASLYIREYLKGLQLGVNLASTELQPADDLAILAGHAFVSLWKLTGDEKQLFNGAAVLEFALTKSTHAFRVRLMLIRIYSLLGAPSLALNHYRSLNVRQVQNDTLSHFILSRASTFSLTAIGDLTYSTECLESSQIYMSNSQETSEFIARAFMSEKYYQIPNFIAFEDRLDNSLQRDITKIEHVRMRIAHEQINSDLVDMELIELKFIFDRAHFDNRDFNIIPNYQPRSQPSFYEQTTLFGKIPSLGWLWMFLKVYIRVFQQASDIDDTVEDKLLVGDRPKPTHNSEHGMPLRQRLAVRRQEEQDELSDVERCFVDYASAFADWLEPYHDHARPPASSLLTDASKLGDGKAHPPKKAGGPASANGHPTKGADHAKKTSDESKEKDKDKDKEAPVVKEAPEALTKFFEDMKVRFYEAAESKLPSEVLHVAALMQEALLLLSIESMRFKNATVVKVHKLGLVVQSLKTIRGHAIAILKDISASLITIAEKEGKAETRATFVDAAELLFDSGIDRNFVLGIAKNVGEARKKMIDGAGKGIAKICSLHA